MKHYPYIPGYPKPDYPDCMPESDCCGDKAHHCPPPPPPPPCPGMPGPGPGEFIPVPPPIEPLHPVPGCNTQEQMMRIVHKTNECISKWNYISSNCYAALNRVVGAAVSNDVYYDRDEVHLENGYSSNDECAYHIITIRSVDKCNQPIRIKLKTAYDNTTNANVRQSMQDVSFIENANAVITAVDPAQIGWKGTTFYCGAPIAGTQETEGYVGGFNDHGALKVFPASVDDLTLRQNCVVDIIGLVTPIITDGEITEQAKAMTTKASISAIGYRSGNGDKIFFQCSAETDKGMQGITVANILKDMGCTTAIITCAGENSLDVKFSNGMMYMGTLTDVPNGWLMPSNCAYWVVSKRPFDGWRNKFTAEIADLVQRVGGSYNEILNNKHRIEIVNKLAESNRDRLDDAEARLDTIEETLVIHGEKIGKLERDLEQEITDRTKEIRRVDGRIDQEITDRTQADEALDHRIDQEITDRTDADNALDEKITQETTERKAADAKLQANIDAEAKARADADLAEQNERIHQDSLLHTEIDKERSARSDADAELASKIQKEASDRAAADTKLTNDLAAEATARKDADVELTNEISAEATARKDADAGLRNQIERLSTGQDVIPIYVKKAGDTMTGNLNMSGNSVLNVEGIGFNQGIHLDEADGRLNVLQGNDFKTVAGADAVADDEFVTKRQLDKETSSDQSINGDVQYSPTDWEWSGVISGKMPFVFPSSQYPNKLFYRVVNTPTVHTEQNPDDPTQVATTYALDVYSLDDNGDTIIYASVLAVTMNDVMHIQADNFKETNILTDVTVPDYKEGCGTSVLYIDTNTRRINATISTRGFEADYTYDNVSIWLGRQHVNKGIVRVCVGANPIPSMLKFAGDSASSPAVEAIDHFYSYENGQIVEKKFTGATGEDYTGLKFVLNQAGDQTKLEVFGYDSAGNNRKIRCSDYFTIEYIRVPF